jgi:DNA-binding response OmpR family regulator
MATAGSVAPVSPPRILYVEDEPSIAEPFSRALEREGFAATVAPTAAEALRLAEELLPHLVLLDLNLPDADGRDVFRELRRRSDIPIIMVTARDSEADRVLGLELGADDYVVKPFSGREVASRIRAVLRRTGAAAMPAAASGPLRIGALEIDVAARRTFLGGAELDLSRKEFDLLVALARRAGTVVTREDLMAEVWDENWFGSTKTLDVHIGWLRRKLADDPTAPRWLHTVRGVGFRFAAPDGPPQ